MRLVIVCGLAVTIHGSSYITFDPDFCFARDCGNLSRHAQALSPCHPRPRGAPAGLPFCFDGETVRGGMNFTLANDVGDIDLMGGAAAPAALKTFFVLPELEAPREATAGRCLQIEAV